MAAEALSPAPLPGMTEEEFEDWCNEDTRAEFVDGRVEMLCPVSLLHDTADGFLYALIRFYLELHGGGRVLRQPFQVRLRPGLRREPDITYVAAENLDRLRHTRLEGAPDAAWEVVSPDSVERDWRTKYAEYERYGVREYWIIDPQHQVVHLYRLGESGYEQVPEVEGRLHSEVISGFWVRTAWLWQEPAPRTLDCLREMGVFPG